MNKKSIDLYYIPIWMMDKGAQFNLTVSDMLQPEVLLNTISKTDIDKYLEEARLAIYSFKIPTNVSDNFFYEMRRKGYGVDLERPSLSAYMDYKVDSRVIDMGRTDGLYRMPTNKEDVFIDTAKHLTTVKGHPVDGPFGIIPVIMYVDNNTLVMTIKMVTNLEDKNNLIESSFDALMSIGFRQDEIWEMPFGRYLMYQTTTNRGKLM